MRVEMHNCFLIKYVRMIIDMTSIYIPLQHYQFYKNYSRTWKQEEQIRQKIIYITSLNNICEYCKLMDWIYMENRRDIYDTSWIYRHASSFKMEGSSRLLMVKSSTYLPRICLSTKSIFGELISTTT